MAEREDHWLFGDDDTPDPLSLHVLWPEKLVREDPETQANYVTAARLILPEFRTNSLSLVDGGDVIIIEKISPNPDYQWRGSLEKLDRIKHAGEYLDATLENALRGSGIDIDASDEDYTDCISSIKMFSRIAFHRPRKTDRDRWVFDLLWSRGSRRGVKESVEDFKHRWNLQTIPRSAQKFEEYRI